MHEPHRTQTEANVPKIKREARHPPVFFRSNKSFPCISTGANPMLNLSTSHVSEGTDLRLWSCTEGWSTNMSEDAVLSEHPSGIDKTGEFIPAVLMAEADNGFVAEGDMTGTHCSPSCPACCNWTGELRLHSSALTACLVSFPIESTKYPGLVNRLLRWQEPPLQVSFWAEAWFSPPNYGSWFFQNFNATMWQNWNYSWILTLWMPG